MAEGRGPFAHGAWVGDDLDHQLAITEAGQYDIVEDVPIQKRSGVLTATPGHYARKVRPGTTRAVHGYSLAMGTDTPRHAGRTLADRGVIRLTFDVPVEDAQMLEETASRSRFNKVTTFIRAIRLLAELDAHQRTGGEILLRSHDGQTTERLRIL